MAFEREPQNTEKWERIISCNDRKEQGRLIREYICELEDEILRLKRQITTECEEKYGNKLINRIMRLPEFRDWLSVHDASMNNYYSDYTFNGGS